MVDDIKGLLIANIPNIYKKMMGLTSDNLVQLHDISTITSSSIIEKKEKIRNSVPSFSEISKNQPGSGKILDIFI